MKKGIKLKRELKQAQAELTSTRQFYRLTGINLTRKSKLKELKLHITELEQAIEKLK